ncbi:MAG: shikimate kinase [Candidatus Omnitrophota bacterium]
MNIYLVGFMGTGKTVVGKALAKKLSLEFVDLDLVIEENEKRHISDIFKEDGEAYFRQKEKEAVREITRRKDMVVAAGGGAVIDPENIKMFKENGVIICLSASADVILQRTQKETHRPLLHVDDPEKRIKDLLEKRAAYYAKADYTVDTTHKSVEDIADGIIDLLNKE